MANNTKDYMKETGVSINSFRQELLLLKDGMLTGSPETPKSWVKIKEKFAVMSGLISEMPEINKTLALETQEEIKAIAEIAELKKQTIDQESVSSSLLSFREDLQILVAPTPQGSILDSRRELEQEPIPEDWESLTPNPNINTQTKSGKSVAKFSESLRELQTKAMNSTPELAMPWLTLKAEFNDVINNMQTLPAFSPKLAGIVEKELMAAKELMGSSNVVLMGDTIVNQLGALAKTITSEIDNLKERAMGLEIDDEPSPSPSP